ncbi:prepilin peptidase [bacterium]|nr:MAG: prepilin peptidase [bacterium]
METHPLILLAVFLFGWFIGSFLNVLIWRLPRDQKITGRSQCPHCKHVLGWQDLVPVFSYLVSGGKCRYCKKKVSLRYPLIELITGALFVLAVILVSPIAYNWLIDSVLIVRYWFIFSVLLIVFIIDLEHYLILNKVVYPATAVLLVMVAFFGWYSGMSLDGQGLYLLNSLLGMIAGFVPFYILHKISKGKWMGLGDAKLGLFLGAMFGFPQIWVCYFIAFLLGSAVSLPLLIAGKKELTSKIPFGTFLSVAALITIVFGLQLANWYFGLIGLV